ncbi:MAG: SET domain-containing protein [Flavobacteriales bacterium]|nr:SET domain-containing protein [Flavobacteriales bacterium]MCB9334986.1 SET domain-containing protein [Flavobacteriales bacterium]
MIHPNTEVKMVNPQIGLGVFATKFIPKGTILYVVDDMELIYPKDHEMLRSEKYRPHIEKFSYTDQHGNRIVSWDYAKYINHYCDFNSISTGYGFEIAIRDIEAGEQITDDYGALNIEREMECGCGKSNCRKVIRPNDVVTYAKEWDEVIIPALKKIHENEQPLLNYVDDETKGKLDYFLKNNSGYLSIKELFYNRELEHKNYSLNGVAQSIKKTL